VRNGPTFVTFDQADTGMPGAVCVGEVEAVYAIESEDGPRSAIRMRSGRKYEVRASVASVLARLEAAVERD
jgi:hypothetical protein